MISNKKITNNLFFNWLSCSLIIVFFIIIIGGLTRLTNSGLSITEWELFKGILPPLDKSSWEIYFSQYKKIPQYKLLNYDMSLSEFKVIFYWEYFHRILARIIGLFFLIPLIYFHFTNKINSKYLNICYSIFFLILLQGVVGWYMVKSGLVNNITVSHYRLAIHLSLALLIISMIFWLIINILSKKHKSFFKLTYYNSSFFVLILLLFFQIIIGAFVSGLDAGKIYQTWPMMGDNLFPDDLLFNNIINLLNFNNHSLVQFYHRNIAYLITIYVLILTVYVYKNKIRLLYKPVKLLLIFLFLQIILGIYTLISGLNIYLASAHQITSVLLVFSAINLYYFTAK
jgi:heme a synthase